MLTENNEIAEPALLPVISKLIMVILVLVAGLILLAIVVYTGNQPAKTKVDLPPQRSLTPPDAATKKDLVAYWIAPELNSITDPNQKEQVAYGKELIVHTAKYFGPNGTVKKVTNGMNCQNCHLQAGTAIFGNNYGSVASLYPKYRARSGTVENIFKRVNDCFERSLNGKAIDTAGREMLSIVAYLNFLGTNVEKGKPAAGSGLMDMPFLDRAADSAKGGMVYTAKCQSCHQPNGDGLLNTDKTEYIYPALWGKNSFNDGAGLYRLSTFAKFVKHNMPVGVTFSNPQLSDEEAWDVGAFITSQQRPHIDVPNDWPDISKKPVDHPFGPYADGFTARQHKLGPYKIITDAQSKKATGTTSAGVKNAKKT